MAKPLKGSMESRMKKPSVGKRQRSDSTNIDHNRIAARAYEIWMEQGCPDGKDREHWYQAESELRQTVGE